jgi:hypothetical protein
MTIIGDVELLWWSAMESQSKELVIYVEDSIHFALKVRSKIAKS